MCSPPLPPLPPSPHPSYLPCLPPLPLSPLHLSLSLPCLPLSLPHPPLFPPYLLSLAVSRCPSLSLAVPCRPSSLLAAPRPSPPMPASSSFRAPVAPGATFLRCARAGVPAAHLRSCRSLLGFGALFQLRRCAVELDAEGSHVRGPDQSARGTP